MKRLCALLLTLALTLGLFVAVATPVVQAASIYEKGIDVSVYQGNINWNAVKSSGHGDFAILRAYCLGKDTTFDTNYANAKAAGVKLGAYCFIYGRNTAEVQNEINGLINVIKGKQFEYPIYVDVEDGNTYQYVGRQATTDLTKMACQMLWDAGFYAGVYTYTSFAASYIYMDQLTNYTTWIADYRGYVGYTGNYDVWQYGCTGRVNGIGGDVDTNYSYTDLTSKIIAAGKNNYIAYMQKFDENEKLKYDSGNWRQMWYITTGRSDAEYEVAQEFRPSDTSFKGVQLYMKIGTSARVKIAIGTTQDNNNTFAREFNVEGNQHEGWYSFDFQRDIPVTKGALYYLRVRITSSNSYGVIYTNTNSVDSTCPIRAYIRSENGGNWGRTDKCIGFNMLTESGMVRYPFPMDGNTMMIYDGDSVSTTSTAYATQVSCERYYRREGTTSLKLNCTNPVSSETNNVGGFALVRMAQAMNLSKYNYISYQVYLPQDMTSKSRLQVNFATTGEDGYNSNVYITGWKAGWHTVTFEKSKISKAKNDADWSKIYNVRIIWYNEDRVATPTYFYFDNLRATINQPSLYPYEEDANTLVLHDGEQDRALMDGYNTQVYPSTSQKTQGEKGIYMFCAKPTGQANQVGGMVFLTLDNAVDLSSYETFSFDLYLSHDFGGDPANPKHKIEVAFSSDDVNVGYADSIYIDGWKAGWYPLKGYFKDCVLRNGQVDRWEAISTVRITWYNFAQDATTTSLAIDNFRVSRPSTVAQDVEDAITALPDVSQITLEHQADVAAVRTAYNRLVDSEKPQVKNYDKLVALEAKLAELKMAADQEAAQVVIDKIAALPEIIVLEDEGAIAQARGMFEELTADQKGYVTNLSELEKAEADLVGLKEKAAAQNVVDLINALPTPSDVAAEDEEAINDAREAYDALSDFAKALIPYSLVEKLEQCEAALVVVKDQAAAKAVEDMIDALVTPTDVTVEDVQAVLAAEEAFNGLTDAQKEYVSQAAKDKLAALVEIVIFVPAPSFTLGDVNDDGKIDAKDALEVLKFAVDKTELTEVQQLAAEVVGDDDINAKDALEILKFAVNKIEKFPIEK